MIMSFFLMTPFINAFKSPPPPLVEIFNELKYLLYLLIESSLDNSTASIESGSIPESNKKL